MAKEVEKRIINRDTEVEIFNLFSGMLGLEDSRGNTFTLERYGDSEWVTVRDVQAIKNKLRIVLDSGALGIKDKDVINFLKIKNLSNGMIFEDEFNKLISNKDTKKLEKKLESLTKEQLLNFAKVARDKKGEIELLAVRGVITKMTGQPKLFD